ncbi:MAG: arylsulfatase [Acidobacteriaceae bacterium]|nr:arylsulfatase [Acidobacteriaceae bacterium]
MSFVALAVATASVITPALAQTTGKKPNVIVIFGDDVGWGDLGAYGGGLTRGAPTPNLDRIAAEGVRFTNWYGQASCTAGRASLITGRIPVRSALSVVVAPGDPNYLHPETPTIAEFYKKNGYTTYMSGKWHLGDTPAAFPAQHGFDYVRNFLAYYAGVYCYDDKELHPFFPFDHPKFVEMYNKVVNDGEWEANPGQPPNRFKEHFKCADLPGVDDEQAANAAQFIKQHANDDKPLFMYIAYMKVHNPNFPAPEWKGKSGQGNFSDSIMELDANVGKVMNAIRGAGIDKNTIVVFSSDNGPWIDAWPDAGYGPFRGMKGTGFENGWRVPGLMWAPGRIPPGTVLHGMMSHMDVWPTTSAMAGLQPPPHGEWTGNDGKPIFFDGYDNSAYVTGKATAHGRFGEPLSARRDWIYIDGLSFLGCRFDQWKFLFTAKDSWLGPELKLGGITALYNLQMDPGEQYDMIFNGAAPRDAGVLATSPGRYAGADNGWSVALAGYVINQVSDSFKKYPNIPTVLAGASLGADLPEFSLPNLVAQPAPGPTSSAGGQVASRNQQ